MAADRPLVLVIEDLHWADRSTRDLVAFLVPTLREVGVFVVLTYRSDELHRRHPLRPLVAAWERVRTVERVELGRFGRDGVTAQVEAIRSSPPEALISERSTDEELTLIEHLDITDGRDADIVTFFVVTQSDKIAFEPDYLSISFRPKTEDWIGSFVFVAPEMEGAYPINLEVSQKNRLIKLITAELVVEN